MLISFFWGGKCIFFCLCHVVFIFCPVPVQRIEDEEQCAEVPVLCQVSVLRVSEDEQTLCAVNDDDASKDDDEQWLNDELCVTEEDEQRVSQRECVNQAPEKVVCVTNPSVCEEQQWLDDDDDEWLVIATTMTIYTVNEDELCALMMRCQVVDAASIPKTNLQSLQSRLHFLG